MKGGEPWNTQIFYGIRHQTRQKVMLVSMYTEGKHKIFLS